MYTHLQEPQDLSSAQEGHGPAHTHRKDGQGSHKTPIWPWEGLVAGPLNGMPSESSP